MLKQLIDIFRKRKILRIAVESGCDADGDLITYKGDIYYVNPFYGVVKRVGGDVECQ